MQNETHPDLFLDDESEQLLRTALEAEKGTEEHKALWTMVFSAAKTTAQQIQGTLIEREVDESDIVQLWLNHITAPSPADPQRDDRACEFETISQQFQREELEQYEEAVLEWEFAFTKWQHSDRSAAKPKHPRKPRTIKMSDIGQVEEFGKDAWTTQELQGESQRKEQREVYQPEWTDRRDDDEERPKLARGATLEDREVHYKLIREERFQPDNLNMTPERSREAQIRLYRTCRDNRDESMDQQACNNMKQWGRRSTETVSLPNGKEVNRWSRSQPRRTASTTPLLRPATVQVILVGKG